MITTPNPAVGNAQIWDTGPGGQSEDHEMVVEEPNHRQSLYVQVFQDMQQIVLKRERFLFSEAEQACLARLNALSEPARYLLIRLCLCKRGKWHTLGALERYRIEIGGKQNISNAIDELCGIVRPDPATVKKEESDIIDLTIDHDDVEDARLHTSSVTPHKQEGGNTVASSSKESLNAYEDTLSVFAVDDTAASVPELLAALPNDDLKLIGKQMKVTKTGQNRTELIDAILACASNQSTLAFAVLTRRRNNSAKSNGTPMRQLTLNFGGDGKKQTQTIVVRQLISKVMERCVRINSAVFTLFDRLNLVFFRSTTHNSSLLLPALLTAFRKRQYRKVDYIRTASIFRSRQALLDYEEALALEAHIDEVLGGESTPAIQSPAQKSSLNGKAKAKAEEAPLKTSSRIEGAEVVREIWETVYNRWKALVTCKTEEKVEGLERFDCGHILTRIVYKGAQALAILKEYDLEIEVLEALLAQTKWRRARRGAWYDRLALVLMTHCEKTQENWKMAMKVVIHGLCDDLTHLIYRPRLERRLTRLEKMLKLPMDERHKCDGHLKKAEEVFLEGVLIKNRAASVVLDGSGRVRSVLDSPSTARSKSETPFRVARSSTQPPERPMYGEAGKKAESWKGKTRWIGRLEEDVSVEQLALEYYEDQGYKGFHSEGRIVSTIFGLLFWDIIFAPVPGAFETPFQTAPLDIHEDSFYSARRQRIKSRLEELEAGRARELLEQVDNEERPKRTWCIGVNWDFEREDLLEIVDCIGGHALAVICQMICEDYGQWRGGVPDLFVWNAETGECKFVEVKSTNDTLQENQKVWIDVLLGAETSVDLCHVTEKGSSKKKAKKTRVGKKRKVIIPLVDVDSEDGAELESEDEDVDQLESQEELREEPEDNKSIRDSDDFVPSSSKRRRVEVV